MGVAVTTPLMQTPPKAKGSHKQHVEAELDTTRLMYAPSIFGVRRATPTTTQTKLTGLAAGSKRSLTRLPCTHSATSPGASRHTRAVPSITALSCTGGWRREKPSLKR
jgi:hypothetical protein